MFYFKWWRMTHIHPLLYGMSFSILSAFLFLRYFFGEVTAEQIFFHLVNPLVKANTNVFWGGVAWILIPALGSTLLVSKPSLFCFRKGKVHSVLKKYESSSLHIWGSFLLLSLTLGGCGHATHLLEWIGNEKRPSILYEKHFVSADRTKIDFKEKKNVVLIYMESMENSYHNIENMQEDLAPSLKNLEAENTSFLGHHQMIGTEFTAAGILAGLCGIPLSVPFSTDFEDWYFAPHIKCIPQVFSENGYTTHYLMGSLSGVGNIGKILKEAGIQRLIAREDLSYQKLLTSETTGSSWGMKDRSLFEIARRDLQRLATEKRPFFYGISTIDTHYPDPFFDAEVCKEKYHDFSDIVLCNDQNIHQFVSWVSAQDFSKNTVIILLGDHLATQNTCIQKIPDSFHRSVINIFIQPASTPVSTARLFTSMDFAPTILAAAGAKLREDAFALGRNLFSAEPTLYELFGRDFKIQVNNFRRYWREMVQSPDHLKEQKGPEALFRKDAEAKQNSRKSPHGDFRVRRELDKKQNSSPKSY